MARQRHLRNAPITEALIDIRATPSKVDQLDVLRSLVAAVGQDYPEVSERRGFNVSLVLGGASASQASTPEPMRDGYLCRSKDGRSVVQFRNDGFTFNRLRPYTRWEQILPEALRLWRLYSAALAPQIFRIAVRYINQLEIPSSSTHLEEYLTAPPKAPRRPSQEVTAFFSRVVIQDKATGAMAFLIQARDPSLSASSDVLILDIDAFKSAEGVRLSDEDVEPTLDQLRQMKNFLFFESVEEPALEKYE